MRKIWLLLGVTLLGAMLALGAIACGDDDDDGDGGGNPTATQPAELPTEPEATEPAGETPSAAGDTVIVTDGILTDADGNTLYIFDNDEFGVSSCGEGCTGIWPRYVFDGEPTAGEGVSGILHVVAQDDGSMQVTYDDQPLYYYSGDSAPGDTNGDGFGGVWHVVTLG